MTVSVDSHNANPKEDGASPENPDAIRHAINSADQQAGSSTVALTPPQNQGGEEPEMALEPDLPSDGRDAVGEAMIRELPQRPELSEPPSQPDPSKQAN